MFMLACWHHEPDLVAITGPVLQCSASEWAYMYEGDVAPTSDITRLHWHSRSRCPASECAYMYESDMRRQVTLLGCTQGSCTHTALA